MQTIQFTLTVEEGKELIALGIMEHPLFKKAKTGGGILLKGGTTVARIAEKISDRQLRISGRITSRGTVSGSGTSEAPHSIFIKNNQVNNIDKSICETSDKLSASDLVICGANAVDNHGQAALMAGSEGGGKVGKAVSAWYSEGVNVLVAAGNEKVIRGDLKKIAEMTGRKTKDLSWGMAVGLILLPGKVIDEAEAAKAIADVKCHVIGSGGLGSAQGSVTLEAKGVEEEINELKKNIKKAKEANKNPAGDVKSLKECYAGCSKCKNHLSCGYLEGKIN